MQVDIQQKPKTFVVVNPVAGVSQPEAVREKIETEFGGLYRFLNVPYPGGPNYYIERIESHMARLRRQTTSATV